MWPNGVWYPGDFQPSLPVVQGVLDNMLLITRGWIDSGRGDPNGLWAAPGGYLYKVKTPGAQMTVAKVREAWIAFRDDLARPQRHRK